MRGALRSHPWLDQEASVAEAGRAQSLGGDRQGLGEFLGKLVFPDRSLDVGQKVGELLSLETTFDQGQKQGVKIRFFPGYGHEEQCANLVGQVLARSAKKRVVDSGVTEEQCADALRDGFDPLWIFPEIRERVVLDFLGRRLFGRLSQGRGWCEGRTVRNCCGLKSWSGFLGGLCT